MTKIVTHTDDDWVCECGNQPHHEGFYPCDSTGRILEPTEDSDWDGLYVCHRCETTLHRMNP
jgi:hypothetical protein